jgi:hypothetical protein
MPNYRSIIGFGALVGTEASYGAGASLSASSDGAQGVEPPVMDISYVYEGERPTPPGTAGRQALASPTGEHCEGTITVEMKGRGAPYGPTNTPPNLHSLLQAAGFTATYASASWTYSPTPIGTAPASTALRVYTRQEMFSVSGAYCDLELATNDGAPMTAQFSYSGLPALPVSASLPVITYNDTLPPKTTDIGFEWGAVTSLVIRSLSLTLNREIAPRQDLNAADGHAGFAVGRREPTLSITVESTDLGTFDPYAEMKSKEVRDWTFTVGSVANNRFTVSGKGQIMGVTREADGPVATWNLEIALVTTDGFGNNDIQIVFD